MSRLEMFNASSGTIKSEYGLPIRKSSSITAPDDWIIEHIAEERSEAHRYSLLPTIEIESQLRIAQHDSHARDSLINFFDKQSLKQDWMESAENNPKQSQKKQENWGSSTKKEDEGPGSLDSLLSDPVPKMKLPGLSSEQLSTDADKQE